MKPLTKRASTSAAAATTAAVARLLAALERAGEPVALAALDDATLAGVAAAISHAADLAGRWLAGHAPVLRGPPPEPENAPPSPTEPSHPPVDALVLKSEAGSDPAGRWTLFG